MLSKQYYNHFCECGCGQKIEVKEYHSKKGYKIPIFVVGHSSRTEENKMKLRQKTKGKIPWNKGKKCPQISKSKIGEKNPMYGKTGSSCPNFGRKASIKTRRKQSERMKGKEGYWKGKKRNKETKQKISITIKELWKDQDSIYHTKEYIKNVLRTRTKRTIKQIKEKYPTFSKEEEIRYNPDKLNEKEIQVHCKNHQCQNSKEQDGWFTPTSRQIEARIFAVQKGNDGLYFYCSEECKQTCSLYYSRGTDPFKMYNKNYTNEEYQTFRNHVLTRDDYQCQYCGEEADHVHHERPQKIEPFFSLDPDYAWSCCEKCHYEKGHRDECSTGKLSIIKCEKIKCEKDK